MKAWHLLLVGLLMIRGMPNASIDPATLLEEMLFVFATFGPIVILETWLGDRSTAKAIDYEQSLHFEYQRRLQIEAFQMAEEE